MLIQRQYFYDLSIPGSWIFFWMVSFFNIETNLFFSLQNSSGFLQVEGFDLIQFHLGLGDRFCIGDLRRRIMRSSNLLSCIKNIIFKVHKYQPHFELDNYMKRVQKDPTPPPQRRNSIIQRSRYGLTLTLVSRGKLLLESKGSGGGRGQASGKGRHPVNNYSAYEPNIARGTTDPVYWLCISSYLNIGIFISQSHIS